VLADRLQDVRHLFFWGQPCLAGHFYLPHLKGVVLPAIQEFAGLARVEGDGPEEVARMCESLL
jgi:hypothetical protein